MSAISTASAISSQSATSASSSSFGSGSSSSTVLANKSAAELRIIFLKSCYHENGMFELRHATCLACGKEVKILGAVLDTDFVGLNGCTVFAHKLCEQVALKVFNDVVETKPDIFPEFTLT